MINMMQFEPKCKTCGGDLDAHNRQVVDVDGDDLVAECLGVCPYCGNQYSWYEHYKFQGVSHVKYAEVKARA